MAWGAGFTSDFEDSNIPHGGARFSRLFYAGMPNFQGAGFPVKCILCVGVSTIYEDATSCLFGPENCCACELRHEYSGKTSGTFSMSEDCN